MFSTDEQFRNLENLNNLNKRKALTSEISPTAEAQWHMIALAYLKALARGYRVLDDKAAHDLICKAIYHTEKSVNRAFGNKDAQELIEKANQSAEEAYIGKS